MVFSVTDSIWSSETGDHLQLVSISFLLIGLVAVVWAFCLIHFEDKWVAKINAKFPNHHNEIDLMNKTTTHPKKIQDAVEMKKEKTRTTMTHPSDQIYFLKYKTKNFNVSFFSCGT